MAHFLDERASERGTIARGHVLGQNDPAPAPVMMDETQFSLIAEAFVKLQNAVDDLTSKMEVVLPYLDKLDDKLDGKKSKD